MAVSPDRKTLMLGGGGPLFGGFGASPGYVWPWDLESRKPLPRIDHPDALEAVSLAFSPDGRTLASGGQNGGIQLWDLRERRASQTLLHGGGPIWAVAYLRNGKQIATGGADHEICRWDPATGKHLDSLSGHEHLVLSLAYSPDGSLLASGSYDKTLKVWDVATGKLLQTLDLGGWVSSLAFSPDGRTLAAGLTAKTAALRLFHVSDGV
jgi:WD40 repeat protein